MLHEKNILFTIILITLLTACSTIQYTEEFSFVPKYNEMKLTEVVKPNEETEFKTATYLVENADMETVMKEYENILVKNKWQIIDRRPTSIEATKENYTIYIFSYQKDTDVQLAISTKGGQ